jgi:hypothetical protein
MKVYLGKELENSTGNVTATCVTVLQVAEKVEKKGHKLYMGNSHHRNFLMKKQKNWVLWYSPPQ